MSRLTRTVLLMAAVLLLAPSASFAWGKDQKQRSVGPGDSIQAAVDAARPGTTILVTGRHRENVLITKDGITLRGVGAVLELPATPAQNACVDPADPTSVNGFCVLGEGDFASGEVRREVSDVTISGFTIRGFGGSGIFAFGAHDATFKGNVAADNGEYGLVAFSSTGTRMLFNRASGAAEAGLYVGDSPAADATLLGNEATDNLFGIFIRNALGVSVLGNSSHGNCVGALVLGDAPGPAGDSRFIANRVRRNTKACTTTDEEGSSQVSGVGIALSGATGVTVKGNLITGNVPAGPTELQGGVVVVSGDQGTAPTNNVVRGNVILRNAPDLFWDGTGSGNVFRPNVCSTSDPSGLCG